MQKYTDVIQSARSGAAIPSARVTVKTYPAAATATIYSDDGVTQKDNPITTDSNGEFSFYAADGQYTLTVSGTGITERTIGPIILLDPQDDDTTISPASDISFVQSGTGATSNNVQAELRHFVRPEQFGAVGDGSTDDTAAIVKALAAGAGGEVLFDAKTYVLDSSDPNFDPASNTTLKGEGRGATVLLFKNLGASNNAVYASQKTGIRVSGMTIKHSTNLDGNQGGVFFDDCDDCQVEDVQVENFDRGIWFYSTLADFTKNLRNKAINCYVKNSYGYSYHFTAATAPEFVDCDADGARNQDGFKGGHGSLYPRLIGCYSRNNTRDGFDLYDGFIHGTISNCVAEGNTLQGFDIKGTNGGEYSAGDYVARDSSMTGCVAEGNGDNGFLLTQLRGWAISGCHSFANTGAGWGLNDVQACVFSSCGARRNTEHGWELDSTSRNQFVACSATDNSYDDGTTQNGTYNGFDLDASTLNIFVACRSGNGTTAGKLGGQGYGFNLDTSDSTGNMFGPVYVNNNVTGTFGGTNVNTTNVVRDYFDSAYIGVQLLSTGDPGSYRVNANANFGVERASGAKVNIQAQSALGIAGTSTNHGFRLQTNATVRWEISSGGHLLAVTDNTYDIGASGATRPRNVFVAGSITTGAPNGGTAAPFKVGAVATVSPTNPDRTIEIDISGTRYFLHAKTTND